MKVLLLFLDQKELIAGMALSRGGEAVILKPRGCVQGWAWERGGTLGRRVYRAGEPAPSQTGPQSVVGPDPAWQA